MAKDWCVRGLRRIAGPTYLRALGTKFTILVRDGSHRTSQCAFLRRKPNCVRGHTDVQAREPGPGHDQAVTGAHVGQRSYFLGRR